ncbi:MAG: hypothetical protein WC728_14440 [Elusimicrobiota bacterium]
MTAKAPTGPVRPIVFNGRQIGHVQGTEALFKVQRSRHFFGIMGSWTLDARVFGAIRLLVTHIIFEDTEAGQTWAATVEEFNTHGERTENRSGVKIALAARHWHKIREQEPPGQEQLFQGAA